jgi:hypothetical protein
MTWDQKIFESRGKTVVQRSIDGSVIASGRVIDVTVNQIGSRQVAELFLTNINGRFQSNTNALNNYGGIEFTDNSGVLQSETRIYPVLTNIAITSQGSNYRQGRTNLLPTKHHFCCDKSVEVESAV